MIPQLGSTKAFLLNLNLRSIGVKRYGRSWTTEESLIHEMERRGNAQAIHVSEKLKGNQELSIFDRLYIKRKLRGKYTAYVMSRTDCGYLSAEQIADLEESSKNSPYVLYRTFTLSGLGHTNGFTKDDLFIPSAAYIPDRDHTSGKVNYTQMRSSFYDIPLEELRPMLGLHLLWKDRIQDEILSFTQSYVFAVVHLYLRHLNGEKDGYISMINRTRASRPLVPWYKQQPENRAAPVQFLHANDLGDMINIFCHKWCNEKWKNPDKLLYGLHPRKFTHEYLTQGLVAYPKDDPLQHAAWTDLVGSGLFELVPELKVPSESMVVGLYTFCRYIRVELFKKIWLTTDRELEVAQELARLHSRLGSGETEDERRPNLWAFLNMLTFRRRERGDVRFQDLIRRLGYTREDLDEGLHNGLERMPANLPEMHSLYHLALDVRGVVGGPPLADLVLTGLSFQNLLPAIFRNRTDEDYDLPGTLKNHVTDTKNFETIRRCGLACDCNIWRPSKQDQVTKGQDNDDSREVQENDSSQEEQEIAHKDDENASKDEEDELVGMSLTELLEGTDRGLKRLKTGMSSYTISSETADLQYEVRQDPADSEPVDKLTDCILD